MKKIFAISTALFLLSPVAAFAFEFSSVSWANGTNLINFSGTDSCSTQFGNWYNSDDESGPFSTACPGEANDSIPVGDVVSPSCAGSNCVITLVLTTSADCSGPIIDLDSCKAIADSYDSFYYPTFSGMISLKSETTGLISANVSDTLGDTGMKKTLAAALAFGTLFWVIMNLIALFPTRDPVMDRADQVIAESRRLTRDFRRIR